MVEKEIHLYTSGSWSLFLDRDGVLNKRYPGDYVRTPEMWFWMPGVLDALALLNGCFLRICVVTNQQGIGKGLYTEKDLGVIHEKMLEDIKRYGGRLDGVYHCPGLAAEDPYCRKPNPGMAIQAKKDFPEIEFERSIMVGDSHSDIAFGRGLGMKTALISQEAITQEYGQDWQFPSLKQFALSFPDIAVNLD